MKKTIAAICLALLLPVLAHAGSIYKQTYGCRSTAAMDKISRMAGDSAAGSVLLSLYAAGECTFFEGGEQVAVTDHDWSSGVTRLHLHGDQSEYWVKSEFVNTSR